MRKYLITLLLATAAGLVPATVNAQDKRQTDAKESFEAFRKGMLDRYNTFRKKTLDDYGKFLEGIWREYDAFRGKERYVRPKPATLPVADDTPQPPVAQTPVPPEPDVPKSSDNAPTVPPAPPVEPVLNGDRYEFYCLTLQAPKVAMENVPDGISNKDFARRWELFAQEGMAQKLIPYFKREAEKYRLNEWLAFELIRTYVNRIFSGTDPSVRISLAHYLLVHYGFDVRVGLTESGAPLLMAALQQEVYARSFCTLNRRRYYLFYDSRSTADSANSLRFSTCDLPNNTDNGKPVDLLFHQAPDIPFAAHPYQFSYNGISIKGEVNANLMPMLYRYPQMNIGSYAKSVVCDNARKEIADQLKQQLQGLSRLEATNRLLQFIQHAFQYATDDEQHGFEKPYFFEEMLFYPQCDCEDRSVFYSYLLWHVLSVENHLIGYPGHECVAVHLDPPIEGTGYHYENKSFFISDPTYIGAVTGMCMPDFQNERPEIELSR